MPTYNELINYPWIVPPERDAMLAPMTSFRVGGPAKVLVHASNSTELHKVLSYCHTKGLQWFILGKGSNLLVGDKGYKGVVIRIDKGFHSIKHQELTIQVEAGISTIKLARYAKQNHLSGLEFLSTIPGTLGGAIFMNAGAYGYEISDTILSVTFMRGDGSIVTLSKNELKFSYRYSVFKTRRSIILSAEFLLTQGEIKAIEEKETEMMKHRKLTQPFNKRTCGSVFINPENDSAGKLIEACGLKGKGIGGARISSLHANFIINEDNATYNDLLETINLAQSEVFKKFGIKLHKEVLILSDE